VTIALLIIVFLMSCAPSPGGPSYCNSLWADCPGVVNDYMICSRAKDLEQEVHGDTRFFSYYNCNINRRTPTLSVPVECDVRFKY